MRKIRFICVGKTQDAYIKEGIKAFEKKLKRFCIPSWVFVREADYKTGQRQQWMAEEAQRLSKVLIPRSYTIACDEKGDLFDSRKFADHLQSIANSGYSQIDFIIGGPFGLPETIVNSSRTVLSLSPLTFTHQMVRIILMEQVYRAFTIIRNIRYHHD